MSLRSCVIAALLFGAAAPVAAESTASASLNGFQLRLIDLDPTDGVTPQISFTGGITSGSAYFLSLNRGVETIENSVFEPLLAPWQAGSASVSAPFAEVSSALSGPGTATGSTMVTTGLARAPAADGFCTATSGGVISCRPSYTTFTGNVGVGGLDTFVLTANTQLVVSVDVRLSVSADGGGLHATSLTTVQARPDYARASAGMRLYAQSSASGGSQTAEFRKELSVNSAYNLATGQFAAVADSFSETFELSFTNLASSELTGFYSFGVTMGGNAFANMLLVPEPESYALMLAGLVSIAAWARRQR